jgi:hypothetical protein
VAGGATGGTTSGAGGEIRAGGGVSVVEGTGADASGAELGEVALMSKHPYKQ